MRNKIMDYKFLSVLFIIWINLSKCDSIKYNNYTMYKATPVLQDHLDFLRNIERKGYIDLIYWKRPHKMFTEVQFLVNPADNEVFVERAKHFNLNFEVMTENIQEAFDAQKISPYTRNQINTFNWKGYHTLEDIYQWLKDLSSTYKNMVHLETIGKSVEGRDILAVTIRRTPTKSCVIVEGGIHGNEWISIEFVTYLTSQLVGAKEGSEMYPLINQYTWYILPIVNPDGFAYNMKSDRLWRKNRRFVGDSVGVDLNRNFDYKFGSFDSSKRPKSRRYCGPEPFSEPETRALAQFINKKSNGLKFYFDIHAFGQQLLIPYSDRVQHLENFKEMENYCKQAVVEIFKLTGAKYGAGTSYDTLGLRMSGNSASWVKQKLGIRYVVTFLLRDTGKYGYALPNDQILPTCQEGVVGMAKIMTAKPKRLSANLFSSSAHHLKIIFYVYILNIFILIIQ